MSRERLQTLFYPFESGALDAPANGCATLVLGADADFAMPEVTPAFVQGFRPDFLALQKRGYDVAPQLSGTGYGLALVLAGKHRGQNERWLAESIMRAAPDGLIIMAGGKTEGVASLRKRLEAEFPVGGHLSKNHGIVFWFGCSPEAKAWATIIIEAQEHAPLVDGRFQTAPGMFSHDRIDAGSRLLAECLPADLNGTAADFCAGWGFLSAELAQRTGVARIDLYEADHASLEAAKHNMARLAPALDAHFHALDLTTEKVERIYDVIVMNPPFHLGRAADPALGQNMIRAASAALKPRGRLFMVANRGLPYEAMLKARFTGCKAIADANGFMVWMAYI